MQRQTITSTFLAASLLAIMPGAARAADTSSQVFTANLAVKIPSCPIGIVSTTDLSPATYKFDSKATGSPKGTMTIPNTGAYVVVDMGGCDMGNFTITTTDPGTSLIGGDNPGIRALNTGAGVWPEQLLYTGFDAYTDGLATKPSTLASTIYRTGEGKILATSVSNGKVAVPLAQNTRIGSNNAHSFQYGTDPTDKYIPAVLGAGGHLVLGAAATGYGDQCIAVPSSNNAYGNCGGGTWSVIGADNGAGAGSASFTVMPPPGTISMKIGYTQLIAVGPYNTSTKVVDPSIVNNGQTFTGTSIVTVTAS